MALIRSPIFKVHPGYSSIMIAVVEREREVVRHWMNIGNRNLKTLTSYAILPEKFQSLCLGKINSFKFFRFTEPVLNQQAIKSFNKK